ncbi:MAG: hypothetical protein P6D49_09260 [Acidimicrobiales bacterium]|jgi:hypothetical protein|nr:hypothetical protein [Acidimicrobiales bacterium]
MMLDRNLVTANVNSGNHFVVDKQKVGAPVGPFADGALHGLDRRFDVSALNQRNLGKEIVVGSVSRLLSDIRVGAEKAVAVRTD